MENETVDVKKTCIFSQNTPWIRSAPHDETKNIFNWKTKIRVHHKDYDLQIHLSSSKHLCWASAFFRRVGTGQNWQKQAYYFYHIILPEEPQWFRNFKGHAVSKVVSIPSHHLTASSQEKELNVVPICNVAHGLIKKTRLCPWLTFFFLV